MNNLLRIALAVTIVVSSQGTFLALPSPALANGPAFPVKDIETTPLDLDSSPSQLTVIGSIAYFTAWDYCNGRELWKTDGTTAGTSFVKDIRPGLNGSFIDHLTNVNGMLYFIADDGNDHGIELWKSDGTTGGTVLVKDIRPGSDSSGVDLLSNVNGTLYFVANDGVHGYELWKSDGTETGTSLVKDIYPGALASNVGALANVDGLLYFVANDGTHGRELWKSDGTDAGTVLVKDIHSGPSGAGITRIFKTLSERTAIFAATDDTTGLEL